MEELTALLRDVSFPTLSQEQVSVLEAPITTVCVEVALASLPTSKTPVSDGIPLELYKQFQGTLVPRLCALYNHAFETGVLPSSMSEALIVLIPKPGKDPLLPESYRPISLLQLDVKILAKILALRLNKVISSLVHPNQTGFMPNKNTAFNLRRLHMNLQAQHADVGSRVVVSLDAAKAFDSVEWTYLWECLGRFGFGPQFIKWLQLLYQAPTARIRVNGRTSSPFSLSQGTRQGCPVSPMLYALAVEPLCIALRHHPGIAGLRCGRVTELLSLYADDMLLYLSVAGPSLQTALQLITQFGKFSGLQINWTKSHILPLDLGPPHRRSGGPPLSENRRHQISGCPHYQIPL